MSAEEKKNKEYVFLIFNYKFYYNLMFGKLVHKFDENNLANILKSEIIRL